MLLSHPSAIVFLTATTICCICQLGMLYDLFDNVSEVGVG